jgi:integrase/recombinase XerD
MYTVVKSVITSDWLVTGHVIELNPAHAVRGPKYVVKKGKTPVLQTDEARDAGS